MVKAKSNIEEKAAPSTSAANVTMNINNIKLSDRWNRLELGDIKSLTQSIAARGIVRPILVRVDPENDDTVIAVDGRRRLAAAQKLGITEIPVSFSTANNDGDAFQDSMVANSNAEPNTPYELAISYGEMVERDGKTNEDIAKSCGRTPGHVSQLRTALRVAKNDKRLLAAFSKDSIKSSVFRHLAKLDADKDAKMLAKVTELVLGGAQAQDIGIKIDAYLEKKAAKKTTKKEPKKRGAAAHKKNAQKASLELVDYTDDEIAKQIVPLRNKTKYRELLVYHTEKAKASTKKNDQIFNQGVLLGLEFGAGIAILED